MYCHAFILLMIIFIALAITPDFISIIALITDFQLHCVAFSWLAECH